MVLYELGIFRNSILVFYEEFYPLTDASKNLTANRRTHIINLISKLSSVVLKTDIQCIDNNETRIFLKEEQFERDSGEENESSIENLMFYAIGDNISSSDIIQGLLRKLILRFKDLYCTNAGADLVETTQFDGFSKFIHEILQERYNPQDRVKRFLLH